MCWLFQNFGQKVWWRHLFQPCFYKHFQLYFLLWKLLYVVSNFKCILGLKASHQCVEWCHSSKRICSNRWNIHSSRLSNLYQTATSIDPNDVLAPNRRQVIIWTNAGCCYLDNRANFQSFKFESKYSNYHLRVCIWKWHLQNDVHFLPASQSKWCQYIYIYIFIYIYFSS